MSEFPKTVYEVVWHRDANDRFSHCGLSPVTVLEESVLPGCSLPTISARDSSGRRFRGAPGNYFETQQKAWDKVRAELRETIESTQNEIARLQNELAALQAFLARLETPEGAAQADLFRGPLTEPGGGS